MGGNRRGARLSLLQRLSKPLLASLVVLAGAGDVQAIQLRSLSYSRQVTNEDHLEVKVSYGVGQLSVRRGDPGLLYRARMRFDEQFAIPTTRYENGRLEVGVSIRKGGAEDGPFDMASMDLELPVDVPMDLHLDFLGGIAELDLTGMPISRLVLNNGASESKLRISRLNPERMTSAALNVGVADFEAQGLGNLNSRFVEVKAGLGVVVLGLDGDWPRDARLSIEMGLGAMEIRIPKSLGVRMHHEGSFLASIDADGFVRNGDTYTSSNWDDAVRRLHIDMSATLGAVELVWIS